MKAFGGPVLSKTYATLTDLDRATGLKRKKSKLLIFYIGPPLFGWPQQLLLHILKQ